MELNNTVPTGTSIQTRKCPHLGLYEDLSTWSATDQVPNYCHYLRKPEEVDWAHQCAYCFRDTYQTCPILQKPRLTRVDKLRDKLAITPLAVILAVAAVVIIAILLLWESGFPPLFQQAVASPEETGAVSAAATQTLEGQAVVLPSATPKPTQTAQPTPTATRTRTPAPSPTSTATVFASPTPGPALMTPFGTQQLFVVHALLPGESLELLSTIYNTSEDVLRALNSLKPGDVLWADRILVILPGVKDPDGVQPRKALFLETDTTVENLVTTYGGTAEQLRLENGLGSDATVPGKRWIVVP